MPNQVSHAIPPTVDVLFPEELSNLDGPLVEGEAEQVSLRGDSGVGCLTFVERKLGWLDDYEHFVFQILPDGSRASVN